jgi:hypothetical protein
MDGVLATVTLQDLIARQAKKESTTNDMYVI